MKFTYRAGATPLQGYVIERPLGHGGFGEVYQAVSEGGKQVALKLVQRYLEVELRGVQQCLNLKHENLVTVFDIRETDDEHWIIMEYVSGKSLASHIDAHPTGMPIPEALRWLSGVCRGVDHLHQAGLVHRDLKPSNVFDDAGIVKVGDYSLTKYITSSKRSGQTQSVGTVHYMAPEIGSGRYGREVDVYAVGVMLYEMLTGKLPYDGESAPEVMMKHLTAEPDLLLVPPPFQPIVGRMLAKDPDHRYSSLQAVEADVHARLTDSSREAAAPEQESASSPSVNTPLRSYVSSSPYSVTQAYPYEQPRPRPRRVTAFLREHPLFSTACAFFALMLFGLPVFMMGTYMLQGELNGAIPSSMPLFFGASLGFAVMLLISLGFGTLLYLWRMACPTEVMLERRRQAELEGRTFGQRFERLTVSLREHPAMWSLCLGVTLAVVGLPFFDAFLHGYISGRIYTDPNLFFGSLAGILGTFLVTFCWLYLWRLTCPPSNAVSRRHEAPLEQALHDTRRHNAPQPQPAFAPKSLDEDDVEEANYSKDSPLAPLWQFLNDFKRSSRDEWFGGVCGGLGETTPVPSWVWRILFLTLLIFYGTGFFIYVLLCIFVPVDTGRKRKRKKRSARAEAAG